MTDGAACGPVDRGVGEVQTKVDALSVNHLSKETIEMPGCPSTVAAVTAFREIVALGSGFDIPHVPLTITGITCAAYCHGRSAR